jgi:hypothetical protein
MHRPTAADLAAAMRIVAYIAATVDYGICFSSTASSANLHAWADASFESETSRGQESRCGYLFMIGNVSGAFHFKTHVTVIDPFSTQESEIQALSEATRYILFFRALLAEVGLPQGPTPVYEDNNAATTFALGDSDYDRTKHIYRHYRICAQKHQTLVIVVTPVGTADQRADPLTKIMGPSDQAHWTELNLNLAPWRLWCDIAFKIRS